MLTKRKRRRKNQKKFCFKFQQFFFASFNFTYISHRSICLDNHNNFTYTYIARMDLHWDILQGNSIEPHHVAKLDRQHLNHTLDHDRSQQYCHRISIPYGHHLHIHPCKNIHSHQALRYISNSRRKDYLNSRLLRDGIR